MFTLREKNTNKGEIVRHGFFNFRRHPFAHAHTHTYALTFRLCQPTTCYRTQQESPPCLQLMLFVLMESSRVHSQYCEQPPSVNDLRLAFEISFHLAVPLYCHIFHNGEREVAPSIYYLLYCQSRIIASSE